MKFCISRSVLIEMTHQALTKERETINDKI